MIRKLFHFTPRVDPDDLNKQTDEINAKLKKDGPRMNSIASYLEWRTGKNGFGTDFEFTLLPKETY